MLVALLASILGAVIFLIVELDNSFRDEVSTGPESIARVYEIVMKPDESARDKANLKTEDTAETQSKAFRVGTTSHTSESPGQLKKN